MTVDAANQISGILPFSYGGTGNEVGYVLGAYTPWAYYPADFASGGTTAAFYGALLKINGSYPTCQMSQADSDRVIGVALGPWDVNTGDFTRGSSTAADGMAAVAQLGVVDVYFVGSVTVGQFVIPSSTLGQAQGVDGMRKNAVGMVVEARSGAGLAKVLLTNALGSISAGSNTQLGVSFFGDTAVSGSVGLMADAGHQHLREPDISALVTGSPSASASTSKVAHPASNVIDGNSGTYWESDGGSPITLSLDLGASPGARQTLRVQIVQAGDALNKFTQYTLAYSDNGSAYTDLVTRTGQSNGVTDTYELAAVISHRYWRWTFGGITGNCQVTAVDIRSVPYGPIDATTGKIPDAFINALSNPMTATGDIIYSSDGSGTPAALAIGSDGDILSVVSGLPEWVTDTALTNPMTTKGDLIVGAASPAGDPARLGVGTDGQVLTADSASTNGIKWAAGGAGGISLPGVVQAKINGTGAITSITLPQAPASGNTLLAIFDGFNSGYISSLACTNVTWTLIKQMTTSGGARIELYAGKVSGVGGTSVTFTNPNSFMTAAVIEISGATVGSTPTAGSTASGQLYTDLLGIAATTSGHLIAAAFGIDNTSANNFGGLEMTIPQVGFNLGRVGVVCGYSGGNPVYVQSNSNVAAAGGVVLGEIT